MGNIKFFKNKSSFSKPKNKKVSTINRGIDIIRGKVGTNTFENDISGARSQIKGILNTFRAITDTYDKIEYMIRMHPDANMAHTSILRLCYNGGETHFYNKKGERDKTLEDEWRVVCSKINKISNNGLDGLINQMHDVILKAGSLNLEVVVENSADGISDVAILHPKYINKKYDKTKNKYIDFQKYQSSNIQLTDNANYFSALLDAEIGKPKATLIYESAICIIDLAWQFNYDLMNSVHRNGFPINDVTIDRRAVI